MKRRTLIRTVSLGVMLLVMLTFVNGTVMASSSAEWTKGKSASLSHSQGTAYIYEDSDEAIQARINVVNTNNYRTSSGEPKYLWAAIVYKVSSIEKSNPEGTKSSGQLLASKYDKKALVSYRIPAKYYSKNGEFVAKTYTSNDVRYMKSSSTYSIIGNTLVYYKK